MSPSFTSTSWPTTSTWPAVPPPARSDRAVGRIGCSEAYLRSARQVELSVPDRRYDLAGWLLARAVTSAEHDELPVGEALVDAAREAGESFGRDARARAGRRPSRSALIAAVLEVLDELGYESRTGVDGVELANCPYHAMAEDYTDVVCGMNLQLLAGVVDGAGLTGLDARLDPAPGRCCVRLCDTQRSPRQR